MSWARRSNVRAATLSALAVVLGGCSGCGDDRGPAVPSQRDAEPEASAIDAVPIDAQQPEVVPDASDDSAADTFGTLDASGGYGPFVGEWNALPGVTKCLQLIAAKPKESVAVLKWAACASGRAGCRMAVTDWEDRGTWRINTRRPARNIAGKLHFQYVRKYLNSSSPNATDYAIGVIERLGEEVVLALGYDEKSMKYPQCGTGFEFGDLGISLGPISQYRADRLAVMSFAKWTAPTSFTTRFLKFDDLLAGGASDTGSYYDVSGGAVFMTVWGPSGIAVYDPVSGEIRTKGKTSLVASRPAAVNGGAIAMHGKPGGLDFIGDDGNLSAAVRPPSGRWDVAHAIDRARADTIVWAETDVDTYARPELWETPFTKTLAGAKPRRAASLSFVPDGMVANAGMALMTSVDASKATLVRVSDGARWTISPEPGDQFSESLWVDDDEVWLSVSMVGAPARGWTHSVLRLSRASLGAPTLDP